jgi:hypothetical protein
MDRDLNALVSLAETWDVERRNGRTFTTADMRRFAMAMNDRTRHMITIMNRRDPAFYSALAELCVHAQTLTQPGARLIAGGEDVTNLRG